MSEGEGWFGLRALGEGVLAQGRSCSAGRFDSIPRSCSCFETRGRGRASRASKEEMYGGAELGEGSVADLAGRRGGETVASSLGRSWRLPLARRPNLDPPKKPSLLCVGDFTLARSSYAPGIGGSEVPSFSATTIAPRALLALVHTKPLRAFFSFLCCFRSFKIAFPLVPPDHFYALGILRNAFRKPYKKCCDEQPNSNSLLCLRPKCPRTDCCRILVSQPRHTVECS